MAINVIGTGLGRTGTMSLKLALEQLGGGKSFHMVELLKIPERVKYLKDAQKGKPTNWPALFEGFSYTVDYPTCLFYKELLEEYPDAKVIHSLRDPEKWYESVSQTIYRGKPKSIKDVLRLVYNLIRSKDMRKVAPVFMNNDKLIWDGQFQSKFEDKDFAIRMFQQHLEEVKSFVPPENLLLFDVKQGWEPLCNFLGHPVPDTPFPKSHERDGFNCRMDRLLVDGVFE